VFISGVLEIDCTFPPTLYSQALAPELERKKTLLSFVPTTIDPPSGDTEEVDNLSLESYELNKFPVLLKTKTLLSFVIAVMYAPSGEIFTLKTWSDTSLSHIFCPDLSSR